VTARLWLRGDRRRSESGALTPAVMVMALSLLLLGGLVTDGGRQLNIKLRAEATADEAARAGAIMIDQRLPGAVLDHTLAAREVTTYCRIAQQEDPTISMCEVSGFGHDANTDADWISVRVQVTESSLLFGIIGLSELHADTTQQASPVQAIVDPFNDPLSPSYSPTIVYPTVTVDPPKTTGSDVTSVPVPTNYTTTVCGTTTQLPLTVGLTCTISTTEETKPPPPPPPAPTTTVTSTVTSFSTYPTSVPPFPN
jgi:Putative Flp pilus-assembly TadE/G-like